MPQGNPDDWDLAEVGPGKYRWIKKGQEAEAKNPTHYISTDTMMKALVHPITGKMMDSKSEFRKVTRDHNCIEVGNEPQKDQRRENLPPLKESIANAWRQLEGN